MAGESAPNLTEGAFPSRKCVGRAKDEVSLVFMGLSDSGITASLKNFLSLCPGIEQGKTRDILKYNFTLADGPNGNKLRVYDIPGFSNTDNENDHWSMCSAIHSIFLEKQVYPNFVLFIVKINEENLQESSQFSRTLKIIKKTLKDTILDLERPNLALILTHYCEAALHMNDLNLQQYIQRIKQLTEHHLGFPVPVEVAENRWEKYEKDWQKRNPNCTSQSHLNWMWYPENILDCLTKISGNGKDPGGWKGVTLIQGRFQDGSFADFKPEIERLEMKSCDVSHLNLSSLEINENNPNAADSTFEVRTADIPDLAQAHAQSSRGCDGNNLVTIPDTKDFAEFANENSFPTLEPVRRSYHLKRSTNSANILLLGITGSGKSHTINTFFEHDICEVNNISSCTKDIMKLTVSIPCTDLKIANTKINIFDVPGYGDTEGGHGFDAQVFAQIRSNFQSQGHLPNCILCTVNITDRRLGGAHSVISKYFQIIRAVFSGSVLDEQHPNLILVATHLCSLGAGIPGESPEDPGQKISLLRQLAEQNLGLLHVPVIVAENDVTTHHLPQEEGNYRLPNGDLYPLNVYEAMKDLIHSIDPVGFGIINEAYPKLRIQRPEVEKESIPIDFSLNADDIYDVFRRLDYPETNALLSSLNTIFSRISPGLQEKYRNVDIKNLSKKLSCIGCFSVDKFPKSTLEKMDFFRRLAPDQEMLDFFRDVFDLEPPFFPLIGFANTTCNITMTEIRPISFKGGGNEGVYSSNLGCYLSPNVSGSYSPFETLTCNMSCHLPEMVRQRLRSLGLVPLAGSEESFYHPPKVGFNLMEPATIAYNRDFPLTTHYEYQLLRVEVADPAKQAQILNLTSCIIPRIFNRNCRDNMRQWRSFFKTHGSHYLASAHLGGSVDFYVRNVLELESVPSEETSREDMLKIFFKGRKMNPRNCQLEVWGGNEGKQKALVESTNPDEYRQRLLEWKSSICEDPVICELSIKLEGMDEIVGGANIGDPKVMREAIRALTRVEKLRAENFGFSRESIRLRNAYAFVASSIMTFILVVTTGALLINDRYVDTDLLAATVRTLGDASADLTLATATTLLNVANKMVIDAAVDATHGADVVQNLAATFMAIFRRFRGS